MDLSKWSLISSQLWLDTFFKWGQRSLTFFLPCRLFLVYPATVLISLQVKIPQSFLVYCFFNKFGEYFLSRFSLCRCTEHLNSLTSDPLNFFSPSDVRKSEGKITSWQIMMASSQNYALLMVHGVLLQSGTLCLCERVLRSHK